MGENELYKGVEGGGNDISKTPGLFLIIYFRLSNAENFYFSHYKSSPPDPPLLLVVTKHH